MSGWWGVQPYKLPLKLPYVNNGVDASWDMQHESAFQWKNLNTPFTTVDGPDPGLYYLRTLGPYVSSILWGMSHCDKPPFPPPLASVTGGGTVMTPP